MSKADKEIERTAHLTENTREAAGLQGRQLSKRKTEKLLDAQDRARATIRDEDSEDAAEDEGEKFSVIVVAGPLGRLPIVQALLSRIRIHGVGIP